MVTIKTEKLAACPICESERVSVFLKGYDYETNTGSYNIEECKDCHIKFTNPRPISSDLPRLYEDRESADFVKPFLLIDKLRSFSIRRFFEALPSDILSGNKFVLDFGCGDGFFSKELADFNPSLQVVATDFHDDSPQRIIGHMQIKYHSHSIFMEEHGKYDVIFCRHVLEHSLDPIDTLRLLDQLLNKDGFLVIEVPNASSIWGKVFGKHYVAFYLPRHLFHFDAVTLGSLLSSFDVKTIAKRNTPLMGRSLGYLMHLPIENTGIVGLSLYPLQVTLDKLARSSSTFLAIARKK
jgi:SAM-dependent methyltransferase